jgi:hypothetical protein
MVTCEAEQNNTPEADSPGHLHGHNFSVEVTCLPSFRSSFVTFDGIGVLSFTRDFVI